MLHKDKISELDTKSLYFHGKLSKLNHYHGMTTGNVDDIFGVICRKPNYCPIYHENAKYIKVRDFQIDSLDGHNVKVLSDKNGRLIRYRHFCVVYQCNTCGEFIAFNYRVNKKCKKFRYLNDSLKVFDNYYLANTFFYNPKIMYPFTKDQDKAIKQILGKEYGNFKSKYISGVIQYIGSNRDQLSKSLDNDVCNQYRNALLIFMKALFLHSKRLLSSREYNENRIKNMNLLTDYTHPLGILNENLAFAFLRLKDLANRGTHWTDNSNIEGYYKLSNELKDGLDLFISAIISKYVISNYNKINIKNISKKTDSKEYREFRDLQKYLNKRNK